MGSFWGSMGSCWGSPDTCTRYGSCTSTIYGLEATWYWGAPREGSAISVRTTSISVPRMWLYFILFYFIYFIHLLPVFSIECVPCIDRMSSLYTRAHLHLIAFYFILFYFILFYFILFYFISCLCAGRRIQCESQSPPLASTLGSEQSHPPRPSPIFLLPEEKTSVHWYRKAWTLKPP